MTSSGETALRREPAWNVALWMELTILLVALWLRLATINAQSLSMDESYDLEIAGRGFAGIANAEDRFPPLYHSLLHIWLKCVPSDSTGRGFSVLCGVILVWVVGRLGNLLAGNAAGLWATLLTAVSPFAVWYSTEARVYSLYLLLGGLNLWLLFRCVAQGRAANWHWFVLASLAGLYTHYYFAILLAMELALLLWHYRRHWPEILSVIRAFGWITLGSIPWLWCLWQDLDQPWGFAQTTNFSLAGLGYTYYSFFSGYSLGPGLRELHTIFGRDAIQSALPWIFLLGVPTAYLLVRGFTLERKLKSFWQAAVLWLGLVPALAVGVISNFASFGYNPRHMLWSFVPLVTCLAVGAAKTTSRWSVLLAATMVLMLSLLALENRLYEVRYQNEDVRGVAEYLASHDPDHSPLVVLSGYMIDPLSFYVPEPWPLVALKADPHSPEFLDNSMTTVKNFVGASPRLWLVYSREFHGDPEGKLLEQLVEKYHLQEQQSFAGVKLYSN